MKKFIAGLCSIIAGICTFVCFCLPCLKTVTKSVLGEGSTTITGFEVLDKYTKDVEGYTLFKIFAIASMVLAGLLFVMGVILLLNNLKVVKSNANFGLFNSLLFVFLVISTILCLIGAFKMGRSAGLGNLVNVSRKPGLGMWLFVGQAVVFAVIAILFGSRKTTSKKRK